MFVERRRVRVSEPDRHLRPRDARGHGLRTPVAAYPVTGPIDVVTAGRRRRARRRSRRRPRSPRSGSIATRCRRSALGRTWDKASGEFLSHLVQARTGDDLVARPRELDASKVHEARIAPKRCATTGSGRLARRTTTPFSSWHSVCLLNRAGSVAAATQIAPPFDFTATRPLLPTTSPSSAFWLGS